MSMNTEAKNQIVSDYKIHEKDTGSPEVQIALLTQRINDLRAPSAEHHTATAPRGGAARRGPRPPRQAQKGPLVPPRAAEAGQPAEPAPEVPDPGRPNPVSTDHW